MVTYKEYLFGLIEKEADCSGYRVVNVPFNDNKGMVVVFSNTNVKLALVEIHYLFSGDCVELSCNAIKASGSVFEMINGSEDIRFVSKAFNEARRCLYE